MKINELKELLKKNNKLTSNDIDVYIEWITPFYDFLDYMEKEYNMSEEEVNAESRKYTEEKIPEYIEKLNTLEKSHSKMKFIVEMSGEIYQEYTEKYNYDKSTLVKKAYIIYLEFVLKNLNLFNGK